MGGDGSWSGRGPHSKGLRCTHCGDTQEGHAALSSLKIRVTFQVRRVAEAILGTEPSLGILEGCLEEVR